MPNNKSNNKKDNDNKTKNQNQNQNQKKQNEPKLPEYTINSHSFAVSSSEFSPQIRLFRFSRSNRDSKINLKFKIEDVHGYVFRLYAFVTSMGVPTDPKKRERTTTPCNILPRSDMVFILAESSTSDDVATFQPYEYSSQRINGYLEHVISKAGDTVTVRSLLDYAKDVVEAVYIRD